MVRSRHSVVVGITLTYILVWAFGVACGLAAMVAVDGSGDPDGALASLGFLVLGSFVGIIVAHVAWIVRTARVLGPYGRVGRTVTTAVLPPVSLVLTSIVINDFGIPWMVWPLVGVVVPAMLSWWATEPAGALDLGGR